MTFPKTSMIARLLLCSTAAVAILAERGPFAQSLTERNPPVWYERTRLIDLTGSGNLDTVRLRAVGRRSDSLQITLTLSVAGEPAWLEAWTSAYHLVDPPVFTGAGVRDTYIREALDQAIESVIREPFDSASYRMMADPPDSALIRTPPPAQVVFSYGYETTVVLRWVPALQRFLVLYECC